MHCHVLVNEFEIHSLYFVYFELFILDKCMNLIIRLSRGIKYHRSASMRTALVVKNLLSLICHSNKETDQTKKNNNKEWKEERQWTINQNLPLKELYHIKIYNLIR